MALVKVYLGDAVYAEIDSFGRVTLMTSDGYSTTNTIVLEPEVYEALTEFVTHTESPARDPAGEEE